METKDLVLLMLIPVILVGLISYTNNAPTVTGAATTQQQEENNTIGSYSIMPSFKAKIDYDLNEYNEIKNELSQAVDECKTADDIGECLRAYASQGQWKCDEADDGTSILYDFLDKFNECMSLEEDGVVCRFSLDEKEIRNANNPTKSFDIALTSDNGRAKAELISIEKETGKKTKILASEYVYLGSLVYTDYDHRDTLSANLNSLRFAIDYSNTRPVIESASGVDSDSNRIPLSTAFVMYKKNNLVKFVEAPGSSFEAPNPANKIIDLPRINGVKFCAKSPSGKQFYAYDATDNTVALRDVVYRFAVTYTK